MLGAVGRTREALEHYEQALQFVPLVLIVLGVVVLAWYYASGDTASLRALQIVMGLFVLSGFAGMLAHFNGSMEYQLELNPDMSTWELWEKILHAKAPPLLAPGMMLQLGLLGLAYKGKGADLYMAFGAVEAANPKGKMGGPALGKGDNERQALGQDGDALGVCRGEYRRPFAGGHLPGLIEAAAKYYLRRLVIVDQVAVRG